MTGIDIVVVNYQTPSDLMGFLRSYDSVKDEVENTLTVVNVCPGEGDDDIGDVAEDIGGEVLNYADNIGYARACNYGATVGRHDAIGFFNADTRLKPGVLLEMAESFDQNARWGVLGPKQVDDEGRITHGGIVGPDTAPTQRGWLQKDRGQFDDIRADVVTVMGSAYFIRRSLWNELTLCDRYREAAPDANGAFLPTQHYYEETFCSYHARAHGYECVYIGTVSMVHRWHKASPQGGHADQEFKRSQAYFRLACDIHGIPHD